MRRWVLPLILCLVLCACGGAEQAPLERPSVPAVEESNGAAVWTDWSKLGDRPVPPETVGTRWYEGYTGELIPREDYGPLIPYAGLRLMDDWPAADGCLYGLMTREGAVITDPVYSAVYSPGGYGEEGSFTLPLLVLSRGDETVDPETWDPVILAVAAIDGSWCTPFQYRAVCVSSEGLLLFQEDGFTDMSIDGTIHRIWTAENAGISREEFDTMLKELSWGEGWAGERRGNYMALGWELEGDYDRLRCFNLESGGIRVFSEEEWDALVSYPEWTDEILAVPDAQFLQDQLLGPGAPGLLALTDYSEEDDTVVTYYREDGTPLPELTQKGGHWYQRVSVVSGLIEVLDLNTAAYYDLETLECVFRTYLNYEGD